MYNYCYLFLLYRELLWELECEKSCLRRYKRYHKKLKQKQKLLLKQTKRSHKCSEFKFDKKYIYYQTSKIYKEIQIVENLINITEPCVIRLRLLKKILFIILKDLFFFRLHTFSCNSEKKYINQEKNNFFQKKAA